MQQLPRSSPRTASAANNPQTNPTRTNNQRDPTSDRSSPFSDTATFSDRGAEEGDGEMVSRTEQLSESELRHHQKVNQVIQNYYTKAALTIVSARVILPESFTKTGEIRQNKWFNVVLPDSDTLASDVTEWKSMDAVRGPTPPLCIEIYLDIKGLNPRQSLVVHDEHGKRWDVSEALKAAVESPRPSGRTAQPTQLVLERWSIEIGDKNSVHPAELRDPLPNVYKKAVVLFRSLYAYLRFLPAYKYYKTIARLPASDPSLKLQYRICNAERPQSDTLNIPLYPSTENVTERQVFTPSNSPIGPFCISVQYRTNCEFKVDDSESLLSSQFMGLDDTYMEPSSGRDTRPIPGSLPVNKLNAQATPELGQAYGSMSTFHQVGAQTGTSPISALRAARDMPSSPTESPPQKLPPNHRAAQSSKSSLRSADAPPYQRRTSVSFQPFKAGSLSSSPALGPGVLPSPSSSLGRPSSSLGRGAAPNPLHQPRNRTSLNALPQAALRAPSLPNETAIASSTSSSPKPAPIARYSSSFGHRRSRFSTGGGSKTEDDNLSSGKGSASSSQQPGSDVLNDAEGNSSGSVKTDDENISDFLKLLETKKDLKSFTRDNAGRESSMRRTTAQLSKYQRMRDSHAALSDSVSSSMLLHRSSTSSSRQLSSVPPMIAGTSVSTASSPGKPISPHTPHTPAIPSRLSAASVIEYEPRRSRSRPRHSSRDGGITEAGEPSLEEQDQATNAIDIPTSPRPWNYIRRSSSVAQQNRNMEDEPDFFGIRSASLPPEEVDRNRDLQRITSADLTSSGLFHQTELLASTGRADQPHDPLYNRSDFSEDIPRPLSASGAPPPRRGNRRDSVRGRGGLSSTHGSSTSLTTGGTSSTERPSRYSFASRSTAVDDEEPLLFQMSEIGTGSRRSLEEGRGGFTGGSAERRRGSQWR